MNSFIAFELEKEKAEKMNEEKKKDTYLFVKKELDEKLKKTILCKEFGESNNIGLCAHSNDFAGCGC